MPRLESAPHDDVRHGTSPVPAARAARRDLLLDVVKALAIIGVIAQHWLIDRIMPGGVTLDPESETGREWLSWVVVGWAVPAFFIVGGALAARQLQRRPARFVRDRAQRLLVPYAVYAIVMATLEVVLGAVPWGPCADFGIAQALAWWLPFPHPDCLGVTVGPLWFLTVFIPISLAAPLLYRLYAHRFLRWTFAFAGPVLLALCDTYFYEGGARDEAQGLARMSVARGFAGLLAIGIVFVAFFVVGFAYRDGVFERHRRKLPFAGLAMCLLMWALTMGPYPSAWSQNQFPPTLPYMLWGLGVFSLLVSMRRPLEALVSAPAAGPVVRWANRNMYTIYLWHMTALVAVWWSLYAMGLIGSFYDMPPLLQQIVLAVPASFVLLGLVALFARCESWRFPPHWLRSWRRGNRSPGA